MSPAHIVLNFGFGSQTTILNFGFGSQTTVFIFGLGSPTTKPKVENCSLTTKPKVQNYGCRRHLSEDSELVSETPCIIWLFRVSANLEGGRAENS